MGRRNVHTREELRELIVSEARRLVASDGVERVSARRLAEAVGYTAGTLYTVFDNLDALFLHVNARSIDALHQACTRARDVARAAGPDDPETPVRALRAMGLAYVGYAIDNEHEFRLMFRHRTLAPSAGTPHLAPRIDALFALVDEELGRLSPASTSADRATAARALWSGVHGVAALGLTDQLYPTHDRGADAVIDSLVGRFTAGWRA